MSESAAFSTRLPQPALEAWGQAIGRMPAEGELPLPLFIALRGPLGV